jgi:hypothetical protein
MLQRKKGRKDSQGDKGLSTTVEMMETNLIEKSKKKYLLQLPDPMVPDWRTADGRVLPEIFCSKILTIVVDFNWESSIEARKSRKGVGSCLWYPPPL